MDLNKL